MLRRIAERGRSTWCWDADAATASDHNVYMGGINVVHASTAEPTHRTWIVGPRGHIALPIRLYPYDAGTEKIPEMHPSEAAECISSKFRQVYIVTVHAQLLSPGTLQKKGSPTAPRAIIPTCRLGAPSNTKHARSRSRAGQCASTWVLGNHQGDTQQHQAHG